MMLIFFFLFFKSGGKILVQFFFKIKVTTDINEFSQLKMALQLPLNEISQPNLREKEPVVVTINKNIKYYTASSTSLLATQTLKEPEVLERSSAGFERHVGVDLFLHSGHFC